jgi:hypothetical protein
MNIKYCKTTLLSSAPFDKLRANGINQKVLKFVLLSSLTLIIGGCASYGQKAGNIRNDMFAGKIGQALAAAEKEDQAEEDVLASMNKGILRRMVNDYKGSNHILEIAKGHIEGLHGVSVTEQLGAVVVNDTLRSFSGDRYEQVLLHAYMAMNYIQMNDMDAARVEILQADVKMQEWGDQPEEDPFVRYLSGMIYEALGERDQAIVAYRQAKEVYQSTLEKQKVGVPRVLKKDLLRSLSAEGLWDEYKNLKKGFGLKKFRPRKPAKNSGELIVILSNGLAPVRGENSIMTFSDEMGDTLKIALPTYPYGPDRLHKARLVANGATVLLETVEDIDSLARRALEDDIPLITARALARAVVKHKTQGEAEERGGPLAGFLATIVNVVTERADTRSWTTLPQEIQMARIFLPSGPQRIRIDMINGSGATVDTIEEVVDVRPGQIAFVTKHWTSPYMDLTLVVEK